MMRPAKEYHSISIKMRSIFVLSFVFLFGSAICRPDEKYTTKYDNVDIEEILKSDRLLKNYLNCILTGEACTAAGQELRATIPDALQTECSKCSEKQMEMTKRVLHFILENKPEMYKAVEAKYDPEGIYKRKYKALLETEGIKVDK